MSAVYMNMVGDANITNINYRRARCIMLLNLHVYMAAGYGRGLG